MCDITTYYLKGEKMDSQEVLLKYRELFSEEDYPGELVCLISITDIVVVREVNLPEYTTPQYLGPHLRFRTNGDIEKGVLFGGDVWEANSIYVDGRWEPFEWEPSEG